MSSILERIQQAMELREARVIVNIAMVVGIIAVSVYVISFLRRLTYDDSPSEIDHLSDLREMRDQGLLTTKEYSEARNKIPRSQDAGQLKESDHAE